MDRGHPRSRHVSRVAAPLDLLSGAIADLPLHVAEFRAFGNGGAATRQQHREAQDQPYRAISAGDFHCSNNLSDDEKFIAGGDPTSIHVH